jgi:hypothetical protein
VRGKRTADPGLHSDTDLLGHKSSVEAIGDGAASPLTELQIMRLGEGVVHQYKVSIPKNSRTKCDRAVRRNIEHALFAIGAFHGQKLTLERLRESGAISEEAFVRLSVEVDFSHNVVVRGAARQVAGLMRIIEGFLARSKSGPGRPPGKKSTLGDDIKLLTEAANRSELTQDDPASWARELREVVKAAYERGELEQRGETEKDAIDIHSKRLKAALRLPKKRS